LNEERTIRFNGAGLDLVINALADRPFREVFALITDIQAQIKAQTQDEEKKDA